MPALLESFEEPWDGFHVGLHEFAHVRPAGPPGPRRTPSASAPARAHEWLEVVERERDRIRRGKSVIDTYGDESDVEFMAVAVEAFFELPQHLRQRHREVYAILSEYFRQDPAAWDDERGLAP